MAYGTPRPPVSDRLRQSARHPFVAALLGGGVVLVAVLLLAAVGVIGGSEKKTTIVQNPIAPSTVADSKNGNALTVHQIYAKDSPGVAFIRAEVIQRTQSPFDIFPQ